MTETTTNQRLADLAAAGVSIWLDDLSRARLDSGNLAELIATKSVTGVTTNPTIFAAALSQGEDYADQVRELAAAGADVSEAAKSIMAADVAEACDLFTETNATTDGVDGRVSIEVDPTKARQTEETIAEAAELWAKVDRSNCLIKIPATVEGLPAITATIAKGISVNVTLIFSLERYGDVIEAYLSGLEQAAEAGIDLSTIHSVASFFVSRVDTEVDNRLDAVGGEAASALKGTAAIANARLAYDLLTTIHGGGDHPLAPRWAALAEKGARPQRPLWASTGVKNPDYSDTMYVTELVVADTVNTMPEKTMDAFAEHGEVRGDRVSTPELVEQARTTMEQLASVGIDMDDVVRVLEDEGVDKFVASGKELNESVRVALDHARG
ncbi:MAG TPA: transaldolase [Candidatus Avipropionibacterium avicola]|uniref:Transaldolase n=1 Tax=Candidatus Avipropionibacterium avicola TaxID=2840701 RepID=A0A9D1KLC5_9ACTN|nr:transaldolase [Candidatus Avipropionibacterium avicola]